MELQIKEEKTPVVTPVPPPPLSALPGGILKQLVRDSEKETKQKEPEVKEEKAVGSITVVSVLLSNAHQGRKNNYMFSSSALQPNKLSNNLVQQFLLPDQTPPILEAEMSLRTEQLINNSKHIVTPDKQETRQEVTPQPPKQRQDMRSEKCEQMPRAEKEQGRIEEVKQVETEERQEPEGRQADTTITEHDRREVRVQVLAVVYLRSFCFYC